MKETVRAGFSGKMSVAKVVNPTLKSTVPFPSVPFALFAYRCGQVTSSASRVDGISSDVCHFGIVAFWEWMLLLQALFLG